MGWKTGLFLVSNASIETSFWRHPAYTLILSRSYLVNYVSSRDSAGPHCLINKRCYVSQDIICNKICTRHVHYHSTPKMNFSPVYCRYCNFKIGLSIFFHPHFCYKSLRWACSSIDYCLCCFSRTGSLKLRLYVELLYSFEVYCIAIFSVLALLVSRFIETCFFSAGLRFCITFTLFDPHLRCPFRYWNSF